MASHVIPVIDFNAYSLEKEGTTNDDLQALSEEICNAFSTVGFCYLKNHGLSQETVDSVHELFNAFFKLDTATKLRYVSQSESFTGYRPLGRDGYNQDRSVQDMMEAFIMKCGETKCPEEIPQMVGEIERFRKLASELALRVVDTISLQFSKEDKQLIRRCHKGLLSPEKSESYLYLRANFYPEVKYSDMKDGQIRFGEHSDFGTLTLLFLDDVAGLEVKTLDGTYIPVHHIPGTVVLNLGDIMQMWTADNLIAAKHRVVFPRGVKSAKERQSLVVFCGADMDTEIRCLDGSDKYEPTTVKNHLVKRMKQADKK